MTWNKNERTGGKDSGFGNSFHRDFGFGIGGGETLGADSATLRKGDVGMNFGFGEFKSV